MAFAADLSNTGAEKDVFRIQSIIESFFFFVLRSILGSVFHCERTTQRSNEIFIKYANEGENYFSYIIVIISALTSGPRVITYCSFSRCLPGLS